MAQLDSAPITSLKALYALPVLYEALATYPVIEVFVLIALGGNSTASPPILKVTCVSAAFGVTFKTLYKVPSTPSNCTVDPLTIPVPVAVNTWVAVSARRTLTGEIPVIVGPPPPPPPNAPHTPAEYASIDSVVELYLSIPFTAVDGLSPVVPAGTVRAPVPLTVKSPPTTTFPDIFIRPLAHAIAPDDDGSDSRSMYVLEVTLIFVWTVAVGRTHKSYVVESCDLKYHS
jgi:hypothetical protein